MKRLTIILLFIAIISCRQRNENAHSSAPNPDTLIADNYILTFNHSDSFALTDNYGDLNIRKEMTDSIGNWHDRAEKIQDYLKEKFGNYFFTTDSSLVLKLVDGKTASFPLWDEKNDEGFNFEHYFKEIDYYLLRVQWGEGNCWMLVNRQNGYRRYISGEPYISIDKRKILAINTDLYAGYSFNGIELYTISGDTLKMEFEKETDWGPSDIKWINDNQFLLKREHFNFDTITNQEVNITDYKRVTIDEKLNR